MKLYCYRRSSLTYSRPEEQPGQAWRGVTLLPEHGIEVLYNDGGPIRSFRERAVENLSNLKEFCFGRTAYDAVFAASFDGIELLVLLRALGLYRKPIVTHRYSRLVKPRGRARRALLRLFYRGIDVVMITSRLSHRESLEDGVVPPEKIIHVPMGPDLPFYDPLSAGAKTSPDEGRPFTFLSTGREGRDFRTLISAFAGTDKKLVIYTTFKHGDLDHRAFFASAGPLPANIELHLLEKPATPLFMARMAAEADCIVCPLNEPHYETGMSTIREAAGIGKPVIVTANPYFDYDIEKEGLGLEVGVGDVDGWVRAIEYMSTHREDAARMGRNRTRPEPGRDGQTDGRGPVRPRGPQGPEAAGPARRSTGGLTPGPTAHYHHGIPRSSAVPKGECT